MTDLITRIEAAKEPRRELFEEAFEVLLPEGSEEGFGRLLTWTSLQLMLDAQAWTSAAEMLLPEGRDFRVQKNGSAATATLWFRGVVGADAAHPSLALLAASLRAALGEKQ